MAVIDATAWPVQEANPRGARASCDAQAITLLGHLLSGGDAVAVDAWIARLCNRLAQRDEAPTLLEHIALAYIRRGGFLDDRAGSDAGRRIEALLAESWRRLTGKTVAREAVARRLPRAILRRASREARLFHLAAFQPRASSGPSRAAFGRDYAPQGRDLAIGALTLAAAAAIGLTTTGRAVLGAAAIGYAIASLVEYGMHRWGGHEGDRLLKPLLARLGRFGAWVSGFLELTHAGHFIVHHIKTSNRNYTAQFAREAPGDRASIDAELDTLGAAGRSIKSTNYGMTLTPGGVATGLFIALPFQLAFILLLGLGWLPAVTLMLPSLLYVAASRNLHPYLHKTRAQALARSGPLMRRLLTTRYAEHISRAHWIHHKGGGGNYNLVPGADLLFGDWRKPNLDMVLRMRADGILGAAWARPCAD